MARLGSKVPAEDLEQEAPAAVKEPAEQPKEQKQDFGALIRERHSWAEREAKVNLQKGNAAASERYNRLANALGSVLEALKRF